MEMSDQYLRDKEEQFNPLLVENEGLLLYLPPLFHSLGEEVIVALGNS